MSENLRRYHSALYAMNGVVVRVDPGRWDDASMCDDWTCREVLGHVIWNTQATVAALGIGERPPEQPEADVPGDDPAATWRSAMLAVLEAVDQQGALSTVVPGPFGEQPLDERLRIATADVFTHTWDIATGLGMTHGLDEGLAEIIHEGLAGAGDLLRQPGLLGPPTEAPAGASAVERYIAFAGRTVPR